MLLSWNSPPSDQADEEVDGAAGPRLDEAALVIAADMDDGVGVYFKEVGFIPLLTKEQEVMLAKQMETGDRARVELYGKNNGSLTYAQRREYQRLIQQGQEAFDHLVTANSRLVISIAKKYVGRGLSFLDLDPGGERRSAAGRAQV